MKRFGFSLNEDLHSALQARADQEGCSMAAICREALLLHLQRPALELPVPVRPDTQDPLWRGLKRQVQDYLGKIFYSPTYDPGEAPKKEAERRERSSYAPRKYHSGSYDTRYLDEIWA